MSDIERLLPDGFLRSYRAAFGGDPPEKFLEAYELLADSLYFGFGLQPDRPPGKFRGGGGESWSFKEPRLFDIKSVVDGRLAKASSALRAWSKKRPGPRAVRRAPSPDHGGHLDQVRGDGRPGAHGYQAEQVKGRDDI